MHAAGRLLLSPFPLAPVHFCLDRQLTPLPPSPPSIANRFGVTGAESGGYNHGGEDVDDSEDGGDRRVGFFKRRKGDARECTGEAGMSAGTKSGGCDGFPNSSGGVFMATGFAEGRTRLEDQEVGYAAFAAFLVRALDQMP